LFFKKPEISELETSEDKLQMLFGASTPEAEGEGEENIQKYFSDLQKALKDSVKEIKDAKEVAELTFQQEFDKDKARVEAEIKKLKKKGKQLQRENIKKMFIKKAIHA